MARAGARATGVGGAVSQGFEPGVPSPVVIPSIAPDSSIRNSPVVGPAVLPAGGILPLGHRLCTTTGIARMHRVLVSSSPFRCFWPTTFEHSSGRTCIDWDVRP